MTNQISVGKKIADARKKRELSQSELADLLALSPQAVSKWERGESLPDILMLSRLAQIFETDLNYFADNDPSPLQNTSSPVFNMSFSRWKDMDFSKMKNFGEKFSMSSITNCRFAEADLSQTKLGGNSIINCDFSSALLTESLFKGSAISNCDFSSADLAKARFQSCSFSKPLFPNARFEETIFKSCSIRNCKIDSPLSRVEIRTSSFFKVTFSGDLENCLIEGSLFSKCCFEDVTFKNCFFKNCNLKKSALLSCRADSLTYSFLKSSKADVSNIEII